MAESITRQTLTVTQMDCARRCAAIARRTRQRLVWALSTALMLEGVELPIGLSRPNDEVPAGTHAARKETVVVRCVNARSHLLGVRFVTWRDRIETVVADCGHGDGFLCSSPVCTWAMASARLSLDELIVLGDSLMRRDGWQKRASLTEFTEYLEERREWSRLHHCRLFRGYDSCCRAVRLMRENTDSSQETRTRLALLRHRLGCPLVNYPLRVDGQQLYLDMAYPEFRVCVEYDGQFHARQWMEDSRRRRLIENAGWQYVQVTRDDLDGEAAQRQLACRVAAAIEKDAGRGIGEICAGLSGRSLHSVMSRDLLRLEPLTTREVSDERRLRACRSR
jgi:very-short-patch-repair endonuclease